MKDFTVIIEEIRAHYGLKQAQMAAAFGMSRQGFQNMIKRGNHPSWESMQNLLHRYPINANFLLMGEGPIERDVPASRMEALEERVAALESKINN